MAFPYTWQQVERTIGCSNRLVVFSPEEATFTTDVFSYSYGIELSTPSVQFSFSTITQGKPSENASGHRYSSVAIHICIL
ncbi:MAG: hypothetical protein U5K54_05025 [Cytophagales bacterium]|nr:hypothetical protein [Cytophagales bacterium]